MSVRNRVFVVIGRTVALGGALALGTAVALAQEPASPGAENAQSDNQKDTDQKDADSQATSQTESSNQSQKESQKDDAASRAQSDANQTSTANQKSDSANTNQRSSETKSATERASPSNRNAGQDANNPANQPRTGQNQSDNGQPDASRNPNRRSGQSAQDADSDPRRGQRDDARRGQRGRGADDANDQGRDAQRRDRGSQRGDPADGTAVRREDGRDGQGRDGERRRGLGIEFDQQVQDGIAVSNVQQESSAARAGLRSGDRIVSADGREFRNARQFQAYISGQYGRPVPLIIEREGQRYSIQLPGMEASDSSPWLGVFLQENEENQNGARITNVYPSGPAARAGLRPGDVITQINGQQVQNTPDLIAMIDEFQPRERVEFVVQRGGQEVQIPAVLGSRENFVYYRQGQEGQQGRQGQGEESYDDEFAGIPPHAMSLEHDRRMAEQHERIESELRKLQDEVRQLRELISNQRQN